MANGMVKIFNLNYSNRFILYSSMTKFSNDITTINTWNILCNISQKVLYFNSGKYSLQ